MTSGTLAVTGDADADALINSEPLALLLGMMLDQQVPMERAFLSPYQLQQRLGRELDAATIASMDPDELEAVFKERPALHRFPGSMAKRAQTLCQHLVDEYGGDAEAVWRDADNGNELFGRLKALPGYGEEKARIFLAVLAKRFGVRPDGWEAAAGPFAESTPRSVADIDGPEALERVRAWKKAQKAKGKAKDE
jgi:uncharacterized HhH-GPD family protein